MSENDEWAEYDSPEDDQPENGHNAKAVLESQIAELKEANATVEDLEAQLKKAKERVRNITMQQIPSTFEELGIDDDSKIKVGDITVTIKTSVHAAPKAENKPAVYKWLADHGHGALVKTTVTVPFQKGELEKAKAFADHQEIAKLEQKVEPMTLKAFVGECIEKGEEIPMDLFGAYTTRMAKIT